MNLTDLANGYGSDKGSKFGGPPHRYTYLYDLLFYEMRSRAVNFLELGLAVGGPELGGPIDRRVTSPSVRMWLDYFPKGHVFGFDVSDFSHMADPRFTFIRGDMGVAADLERLAGASIHYDVVIDDASHASFHQQLALKTLWRRVAPGGLYIIEDLHWQPEAYENSLPRVPKTAALISSYFERGEYIESPVLGHAELDAIRTRTHSFAVFPSFSDQARVKLVVLRLE